MLRSFRCIALLPIVLTSCLAAQDTRPVIEPLFPPLCTTVDAQLETSGSSLAAVDEQELDTARIQRAINRCGKGRAVMLRVDEGKNAFLSGPLELRTDVALILGRGVTLFASRDPALYALSPGSCGVVNNGGAGCKPLISVDHAPDAGIMGDGIIDGRGGETMLGSKLTWWELAAQAHGGGQSQVPSLIAADNSDNLTLYRITVRNAPSNNVVFSHGNGLTAWAVRIGSPRRQDRKDAGIISGPAARNVTVTHSFEQNQSHSDN